MKKSRLILITFILGIQILVTSMALCHDDFVKDEDHPDPHMLKLSYDEDHPDPNFIEL